MAFLETYSLRLCTPLTPLIFIYYSSVHREKGKYKTIDLNRLILDFPFGLLLSLELLQF